MRASVVAAVGFPRGRATEAAVVVGLGRLRLGLFAGLLFAHARRMPREQRI
jgi:hypothetical protein